MVPSDDSRTTLKTIRFSRFQGVYICFLHRLRQFQGTRLSANQIKDAQAIYNTDNQIKLMGNRITDLFKFHPDLFYCMPKFFSHCFIQPAVHIIASGMLCLNGWKGWPISDWSEEEDIYTYTKTHRHRHREGGALKQHPLHNFFQKSYPTFFCA
jgi:hypothetical protein